MQLRFLCSVLRTLGAGLAVYATFAACSGASSPDSADDGGSPVPEASAAGEAGGGGGGGGSAPSLVATEKCTHEGGPTGNGRKWMYAEHAFAGKSKIDLARVEAMITEVQPSGMIPGYDTHLTPFPLYSDIEGPGIYVKDGSVAVICGEGELVDPATTVTFVLPQ